MGYKLGVINVNLFLYMFPYAFTGVKTAMSFRKILSYNFVPFNLIADRLGDEFYP